MGGDAASGASGTLPIFPLTGVLLLPGGRLPLNVFEPRYLNMVNDALARDRMIGMVQPKEHHRDPVPGDAPIFPVGCAGRIVSFAEADDGRILITLMGTSRFRVASEVAAPRGYRRVVADFGPFAADLDGEAGSIDSRGELLATLKTYFRVRGMDADWETIEHADDDALVTSLAMACPFAPDEKQALLECGTTAERGRMLAALMEMAVMASGDRGSPARH